MTLNVKKVFSRPISTSIPPKPGDTLLFRGSGLLFHFFNLLLNLLDPRWRRRTFKPWHTAILLRPHQDGWVILEGTYPHSQPRFVPRKVLSAQCRFLPWMRQAPLPTELIAFEQQYTGKKYDILIYFWTMAQYLFRHYWNRSIPNLLDDRYTCWELVGEWYDFVCDPIHSKYDCIIIENILSAAEARGIPQGVFT